MNNQYSKVITALLDNKAHVATQYVSPKRVIRATRRHYRHGGFDRRTVEIQLTDGPPNYAERAFIKTCIAAGEPFPVKKVQLKMPVRK